MSNIQLLEELLRQVPDTYEDFTNGIISIVKKQNDEYLCSELIKFMENNSKVDSSAVCEKAFEIFNPWEDKSQKTN